MAFAQGSRSSLSYIKEVDFGVTPEGDFTNLPINTHSLNTTKERVEGNEIQSDRMTRVDRHGNRQAGGDIVVDLRGGDYDEFLEAVMFNEFVEDAVNDTLKVGVEPIFFSIEDAFEDVEKYRLFSGMAVSGLQVSIAPNQMVTTTFTMVGKDGVVSETSSSGTVQAPSANQPFDSFSGEVSIGNVGASSVVNNISQIEVNIQNNIEPTFVVGSPTTPQLEFGRANVEGTLTAYFEDLDLIDRFIDEIESELSVSINDPSGDNEYTFVFPRIKINSADVPLENEQSRLVTLNFVAIYESGEDSNLTILRPPSL